jgi:hypothetical protein
MLKYITVLNAFIFVLLEKVQIISFKNKVY